MSNSELYFLAILSSDNKNTLTRIEIYKACIALANNGQKHTEELHLAPQERQLLDIRRQIFHGYLETSREKLNELIISPLSPLHRGDILYLMGAIEHRLGSQDNASIKIREAAEAYAIAEDTYRKLRAFINSYICKADLQTYLTGELLAFEQQARREKFYDLVALILRGRAHELMIQNCHHQALPDLEDAIRLYELDGAPADRAVAQCMMVIAYYLLDEIESAENLIKRVLVRDGKVSSYISIINDLANGRYPKIENGHPFERANWKIFETKRSSIIGKILKRLMQGPASRDEIISFVWGEKAIDPSYCNRLYTAVSKIKKMNTANIVFDGNLYKLVD
jgi:tetratricopeptide (TPR) repeat protein